MPRIESYRACATLEKRDGRTREARLAKSLRAELERHCGQPSIIQRLLIDQACDLQLRLAAMNREFAQSGKLTKDDANAFLAWSNAQNRLLCQLGLKASTPAPCEFAA